MSMISSDRLLGRVLRAPLRWVPRNATMSVLSGPLRGTKWVVGAATHGAWLGTYERSKTTRFASTIKPGDVVYDVGAHVGYYSLLASRRVGPDGQVVAFEPVKNNLNFLNEHLRLNEVSNVRVVAAAVSDRVGILTFTEGEFSQTGRIDLAGRLEIPAVTLDDIVFQQHFPAPDVIKMDVEGAENLALRGAKGVLERHHPTIFLATHGREVNEECREFLASLGYEIRALDERPLKDSDELLASFSG